MRYLFIDTSNSFINIYIVNDETVLVHKKVETLKDMANTIMPLIRESFNEINFDIKDVDKIFVTNGPGSFTGIRVGITVAKTISWGLNIPVYPISTLEYLASISTNYNKIISIIDARRGNVFAGFYDSNLNKLEDEKMVSYDAIDIPNDTVVVSYDGVHDSKILDIDIIKLINKHRNDNKINPHMLVPNYLKKTEAEEKLND